MRRTGVQSARWSPSGDHIVIVADFQIRMTVWSLEEHSSLYFRGPKYPEKGFEFSPDCQLLAVAEVRFTQGLVNLDHSPPHPLTYIQILCLHFVIRAFFL